MQQTMLWQKDFLQTKREEVNGGQALNPGTKMRLINIQEYYAFKNHATNIGDITWAYYSDSGTENGITYDNTSMVLRYIIGV